MSEPAHRVDPGTGIGLGSVFASMGLLIVFVAIDVVPVPEESVHAPRWVVALAGLVFVLAGGVILGYGIRNALDPEARDRPPGFSVGTWLAGHAIVTIFAVITGWIAFGSGSRGLGTRIPFGIIAVGCVAIAVGAWVHGVRRLRRGDPDEPPRTKG